MTKGTTIRHDETALKSSNGRSDPMKGQPDGESGPLCMRFPQNYERRIRRVPTPGRLSQRAWKTVLGEISPDPRRK